MSTGMKVSMNIYALSIFCSYTNHDYVRSVLDIYRERRKLWQATSANPVSPKLFGNYFSCEDE